MADKYAQKYEQGKRIFVDEGDNGELISSNLEKGVEKSLEIVQNLSTVWGSSDYAMKQTLQYLIFQ